MNMKDELLAIWNYEHECHIFYGDLKKELKRLEEKSIDKWDLEIDQLNHDVMMVTMTEAFAESAPQFVLQLTIKLREDGRKLGAFALMKFLIDSATGWTIFTSMISVIVSVTNMYLKMPYSDQEKPHQDLKKYVYAFPVAFVIVVPRLIALSSFVACFTLPVKYY